jgi:ribulose 1,5-bisphosphate synthetase/thiazole synthase
MHELPSILRRRAILDVIIVGSGQAGLAAGSC